MSITNDEKKQEVFKVLAEVQRICNDAIDKGLDVRLQVANAIELINEIWTVLMLKQSGVDINKLVDTLKKQIPQDMLPPEFKDDTSNAKNEASNEEDFSGAIESNNTTNVVAFPKKKSNPTFH